MTLLHAGHLGSESWLAAVLLVLAAGGYASGVVRLRRRGDSWPLARGIAAAAGLTALAIALLPPLASRRRLHGCTSGSTCSCPPSRRRCSRSARP